MPMVTYYVALPFTRREDGGLAPGQAVDCPSLAAALQRAEAPSRAPGNAGAIAFFRGGDANLGEFLRKKYGSEPLEMYQVIGAISEPLRRVGTAGEFRSSQAAGYVWRLLKACHVDAEAPGFYRTTKEVLRHR